MYKLIPHLKLDASIENSSIYSELLAIDDYYGLQLQNNISQEKKKYYFSTSLGHALRSYAPNKRYAYYIEKNTSLWIDRKYEEKRKFFNTDTWNECPLTTDWITKNICSLDGLKIVSLHKLKKKSSVDWHSHYVFNNKNYPYRYGVVHISLITDKYDLSEVKLLDEVDSKNYKRGEVWLFNSYLPHRSVNNSKNDRIHLVLECNLSDHLFSKLLHRSIHG